ERPYSVRVAPPVGKNHRYVHVSAPSPSPVDGWAVTAVRSVPMDPVGWRVYRVPLLTSCPGAVDVIRNRGLRRNRGLPVDQPNLVAVKDDVDEADVPVPHPGPVNPVDQVPELALVPVRVFDRDIQDRGALLGDDIQVTPGDEWRSCPRELVIPGDLSRPGHTALPSVRPLFDYPVLTVDDVRLHAPQLQWKYPRTLPRFEATRPSDNSSAISSNVQCSRWISNQLPSTASWWRCSNGTHTRMWSAHSLRRSSTPRASMWVMCSRTSPMMTRSGAPVMVLKSQCRTSDTTTWLYLRHRPYRGMYGAHASIAIQWAPRVCWRARSE